MSQQQSKGITENQLFQQFTKSNQVCTNSFQLLFDTAMQMQQENQMLNNLLKANNIKIPTQPLPEGTRIADATPAQAPPNRKQRREAEKKSKK